MKKKKKEKASYESKYITRLFTAVVKHVATLNNKKTKKNKTKKQQDLYPIPLCNPIVFRSWISAVSYTHLDVYKRQVSSLSSSSTGSATSSDNDDNVLLSREERVRNYGLAYGAGSSGDGSGGSGGSGGGNSDSNIEDDVDIDELMSDQNSSTSLSRSSSQKSGH